MCIKYLILPNVINNTYKFSIHINQILKAKIELNKMRIEY